MKKALKIILWLYISLGSGELLAQQNLTYNHYYLNPFLYNPSFIAQSGYSELYLNYRHQWVGFEGAPKTATMNLQLPLNYKSGLAITGFQDEAGQIKTTTGLVSFSYQVFLGKRISDLHKIGFGVSAGYTNSRISTDDLSDYQDPVLGNRTSSLDGQFGMHYQHEKFKIAFAIPRLFQTNVAAEERFTHRGISQIKNTITSISYDFTLSPFLSLEPIVTYRTYQGIDAQYEALASLKLAKTGWIGAAYRQDYGVFAFLGFDIKEKLKVGYAYEFATDQTDKMGYGSHEIQLSLRLGKKQFVRPQLGGKTAATSTNSYAAQYSESEEEPEEEPEGDEEYAAELASDEQEDELITNDPSLGSQPVIETYANTVNPNAVQTHQPDDETEKPVQTGEGHVKLNGDELAPGHYVVVGVFVHLQNAREYTATLKRAGYPASVAFNPVRNQYIVHMRNAPTIEEARQQRDQYRKMSRYSFRDTWVLTVD